MSGNYPAGVTDNDPYFTDDSEPEDGLEARKLDCGCLEWSDGTLSLCPAHLIAHDPEPRMCPACRGKGEYPGTGITCRTCHGSGIEQSQETTAHENLCLACEEPTPDPYCPACTERYAALRDPDHLRPDKGGNRASNDYWDE